MIRGGTKVAKVRQSQGSRTSNCNTSCFNLDGLGPQARCAAPRQAKPVPLLSRVLFLKKKIMIFKVSIMTLAGHSD